MKGCLCVHACTYTHRYKGKSLAGVYMRLITSHFRARNEARGLTKRSWFLRSLLSDFSCFFIIEFWWPTYGLASACGPGLGLRKVASVILFSNPLDTAVLAAEPAESGRVHPVAPESRSSTFAVFAVPAPSVPVLTLSKPALGESEDTMAAGSSASLSIAGNRRLADAGFPLSPSPDIAPSAYRTKGEGESASILKFFGMRRISMGKRSKRIV